MFDEWKTVIDGHEAGNGSLPPLANLEAPPSNPAYGSFVDGVWQPARNDSRDAHSLHRVKMPRDVGDGETDAIQSRRDVGVNAEEAAIMSQLRGLSDGQMNFLAQKLREAEHMDDRNDYSGSGGHADSYDETDLYDPGELAKFIGRQIKEALEPLMPTMRLSQLEQEHRMLSQKFGGDPEFEGVMDEAIGAVDRGECASLKDAFARANFKPEGRLGRSRNNDPLPAEVARELRRNGSGSGLGALLRHHADKAGLRLGSDTKIKFRGVTGR